MKEKMGGKHGENELIIPEPRNRGEREHKLGGMSKPRPRAAGALLSLIAPVLFWPSFHFSHFVFLVASPLFSRLVSSFLTAGFFCFLSGRGVEGEDVFVPFFFCPGWRARRVVLIRPIVPFRSHTCALLWVTGASPQSRAFACVLCGMRWASRASFTPGRGRRGGPAWKGEGMSGEVRLFSRPRPSPCV